VTPVAALLAEILVSLALSTAVLAVMAHPLRLILKQLCPGTEAGAFWIVFTGVMLYLTPLLFAVFFSPTATVAEPVSVIRAALVGALFGAFAALLVVGYQVAHARPGQTASVARDDAAR
jgi:hypothetical protein